MEKLANMLHSLCCDIPHQEDMTRINDKTDSMCHYYLEQTISDPWSQPDHLVWMDEARKLILDLGVSSHLEALDILKETLSIIRGASILIDKHPSARGLLIKLLS